MKIISTLLFLLISVVSISQSNLTIFNNGGQQFFVILNGIKQNSLPMTNVVVSGLKNGSYSVKLIFADGKTSDIDKNFFLEEASDITTRVVFKKGKGKLQLIGMEPTKGEPKEADVITYRPNDSVPFSDSPNVTQTIITQETVTNTQNTGGQNVNMNVGVNNTGQNQSIGTTTNVNESQSGQNVNQSVNVVDPNNPNGSVGMNVNINVTDPTMGGQNVNMSVNMGASGMGTQTTQTNSTTQQSSTYSQTTTVTTSGSTVNSGANGQQVNSSNQAVSGQSVVCKNLLGDADKMAQDLKDLMMDDDRVKALKMDLETFCLTASQAYKLVEVLTFEENRLEAAMFLYDHMIDKDKANILLPLFTFDDSKIKFREYMSKKK